MPKTKIVLVVSNFKQIINFTAKVRILKMPITSKLIDLSTWTKKIFYLYLNIFLLLSSKGEKNHTKKFPIVASSFLDTCSAFSVAWKKKFAKHKLCVNRYKKEYEKDFYNYDFLWAVDSVTTFFFTHPVVHTNWDR